MSNTTSLLTRAEQRANARDPFICPRCHDTKSASRELCAGCTRCEQCRCRLDAAGQCECNCQALGN